MVGGHGCVCTSGVACASVSLPLPPPGRSTLLTLGTAGRNPGPLDPQAELKGPEVSVGVYLTCDNCPAVSSAVHRYPSPLLLLGYSVTDDLRGGDQAVDHGVNDHRGDTAP